MDFKKPFRVFVLLSVTWLLIFLSAVSGNAEMVIDADRQYDYAHSRFMAGSYDEAIIEFNRFIYFFPEDPRIDPANFQIGMAHFNAGRNSDAAGVFSHLIEDSSSEELMTDAYFMLSRSHAGFGNLDQAMLDLRNLMTVTSDPDVLDRARYELAWLLIDQGRWSEADQVISGITTGNFDQFHVAGLQQDLAKFDQIPRKSTTTAGFLSILPGAGQAYCGRYQDALTAFLVNAGLICAAWEAFDNELYALGAVIGFVEFGFYAGNIYGAVSGAHKYNRDRISEFRDGLIQKNRVQLSLGPIKEGWAVCLKMDF